MLLRSTHFIAAVLGAIFWIAHANAAIPAPQFVCYFDSANANAFPEFEKPLGNSFRAFFFGSTADKYAIELEYSEDDGFDAGGFRSKPFMGSYASIYPVKAGKLCCRDNSCVQVDAPFQTGGAPFRLNLSTDRRVALLIGTFGQPLRRNVVLGECAVCTSSKEGYCANEAMSGQAQDWQGTPSVVDATGCP